MVSVALCGLPSLSVAQFFCLFCGQSPIVQIASMLSRPQKFDLVPLAVLAVLTASQH